MQSFQKRFSVITGFALLLVLLIANAFVTRRQLARQISNQALSAHSRMVLYELAQTESLLKDAETGQRGYLYTGDSRYLAPYELAIGQVMPHIGNLAQLTADDSRQQIHVAEFRELAQQKLVELAQTLSLYQAGNSEAAKGLVQTDAGLLTMGKIRKLTGEMEQEEDSLEAERVEAYRKSVWRTYACVYLASALATCGLVLLGYFILREMDLRERHSRQMLEREEWFRLTLTSLGDAVIATDENGNVTFLNSIAEQLTGRKLDQTKGKPIHEVFPIFNESTHNVVENPVKKVMELGRVVGLANHTVLLRTDGTYIPIEDSAAPIRDIRDKLIGVVLVFRDATFERKSQDMLRKSEKLAAAARLAATVAHEINNPLEAIGNLLYLARETPGLPEATVEHLTLAEHELERVSHISRQTLGFYRESSTPSAVELPVLIDSVMKIYSNKFKSKNIDVQCEFGDCPVLHGLAGELKQAMSNLISNAADAVSENGKIRVKTVCAEGAASQVVKIVIEDDGPGIAAEQKERIFEPFFTTKKDVGTGLGLWVTREIVERHGGTIEVSARESGTGAVFTVVLPFTGEMG